MNLVLVFPVARDGDDLGAAMVRLGMAGHLSDIAATMHGSRIGRGRKTWVLHAHRRGVRSRDNNEDGQACPPSRVIGKIISRRASKDASYNASESAGRRTGWSKAIHAR